MKCGGSCPYNYLFIKQPINSTSMKQTKTLLVLGALLCSSGAAMAQNDLLLVASPPDGGQEQSVPIYVGSTVSFSTQGVVINGDKAATFNWGSFTDLSFKVGSSGIHGILADGKLRLRRNPVETMLEFTGYDGKAANLAITDLNGRRCITVNNWNGENVNVASLTPGLYFVTINNNSIKFIKK